MALTTKLKTRVVYELVSVDANGKEVRQQMKKVDYEYTDFDTTQWAAFLATAANTLNHGPN